MLVWTCLLSLLLPVLANNAFPVPSFSSVQALLQKRCRWVTGHTYVAYGPLLAGATNVLFGSTPMFPTIDRVWEVIARYKVRYMLLSSTDQILTRLYCTFLYSSYHALTVVQTLK